MIDRTPSWTRNLSMTDARSSTEPLAIGQIGIRPARITPVRITPVRITPVRITPVRISPLAIGLIAAWMVLGCHAEAEPTTPAGDPLMSVSGQELYQQGLRYAEAQEYVRAEQYLSAAMERGYPEAEAIRPLIAVCVRGSRLSSALAYAEPYLMRHPDDWPLRLLVATLLMSLDETSRAYEELVRVTREQPDEPAGHYMLAVLHRDALSNEDAAVSYFQHYLDLAPEGEHAREAASAIELARLRRDSSSSSAADSTGAAADTAGPELGASSSVTLPTRVPFDSASTESPQ